MARVSKNRQVKGKKERKVEDHITDTSWGVEKDGLDTGKDIKWEATKGEVHSKTTFEDDAGEGIPVIIRAFQFQLPPGLPHTPSKQELLDHHTKRIEVFLWKDGLELIQEPKVVFGKKGKFEIFALCTPSKGNLIWNHTPQTLSQIANARPTDSD